MADIHHDPTQRRFHDGDALLAYDLPAPGVIAFRSVQVPPERRGQGLAADLTHAAFAYAAEQNLSVRPDCPYVSGAFLKRHPAYRAQVQA